MFGKGLGFSSPTEESSVLSEPNSDCVKPREKFSSYGRGRRSR